MNLKRVLCVAFVLTLLVSAPSWAGILNYVDHNTNLDGAFDTDYVDNPTVPIASINFNNSAGIETNPASLADMYWRVANQVFNASDPWGLYNPQPWNGPGYTSGLAKTNAKKNTTIGIMTGAQWIDPVHGYGPDTQFFGKTVTSNMVLMRYSYMGDFNLDGSVDNADIAQLITGLTNPGAAFQTYFYGDSDYDESVGNADIANLITGLTTAGTELPNWTPPYTDNWPTGGPITPVPEPSTIVLLILACTIGLAARKKF